MTVYIEYVLIDNFVIDYLLLKATFSLTKTSVKKGRLFFCAFLGACFALIYPLLTITPFLLALIKLLTGMLLPLLATDYTGIKHYFITTLLFMGMTFTVGGVITGVFSLLGLNASSEFSIALMILPVYVTLKCITEIVSYLNKTRAVTKNLFPCELVLGDKTVKTDGFMDTGNALYDGDNPVIVCERKLALKLLSNKLPKLKRIDCETVIGKTKILAMQLTELRIYYGDTPNIIKGVTLAVTDQKIGTGYGVILHPALMESKDADNTYKIERPA